MTDTDAGADGRKPVRPRGSLTGGQVIALAAGEIVALAMGEIVTLARSRWAARALIVLGLVLAGAGGGTAISRATERPVTQPSAPNDPQAGEVLMLPSTNAAKIPGATPLPVAAPEVNAAAAIAIHIPRLKVDQDLVGLRVQSDNSLTVPDDFDEIGWWSGGPHPGGPGAALFAGHLNNVSGPAVFFELRTMRVGDLITVDRGDQTSAVFKVVGRASFPRTAFPDEVVYRTTGKPSIHLVTCDGTFDQAAGHHADNLVVFADLVSTRATPKAKP